MVIVQQIFHECISSWWSDFIFHFDGFLCDLVETIGELERYNETIGCHYKLADHRQRQSCQEIYWKYEIDICKKYTRNIIMIPMAVTINWLIPGSAKVAKKDKNLAELLQPIAIILFALSIIFPPFHFHLHSV